MAIILLMTICLAALTYSQSTTMTNEQFSAMSENDRISYLQNSDLTLQANAELANNFFQDTNNLNNNKELFQKFMGLNGVTINIRGNIKTYDSNKIGVANFEQPVDLGALKAKYAFEVDSYGNLLLKPMNGQTILINGKSLLVEEQGLLKITDATLFGSIKLKSSSEMMYNEQSNILTLKDGAEINSELHENVIIEGTNIRFSKDGKEYFVLDKGRISNTDQGFLLNEKSVAEFQKLKITTLTSSVNINVFGNSDYAVDSINPMADALLISSKESEFLVELLPGNAYAKISEENYLAYTFSGEVSFMLADTFKGPYAGIKSDNGKVTEVNGKYEIVYENGEVRKKISSGSDKKAIDMATEYICKGKSSLVEYNSNEIAFKDFNYCSASGGQAVTGLGVEEFRRQFKQDYPKVYDFCKNTLSLFDGYVAGSGKVIAGAKFGSRIIKDSEGIKVEQFQLKRIENLKDFFNEHGISYQDSSDFGVIYKGLSEDLKKEFEKEDESKGLFVTVTEIDNSRHHFNAGLTPHVRPDEQPPILSEYLMNNEDVDVIFNAGYFRSVKVESSKHFWGDYARDIVPSGYFKSDGTPMAKIKDAQSTTLNAMVTIDMKGDLEIQPAATFKDSQKISDAVQSGPLLIDGGKKSDISKNFVKGEKGYEISRTVLAKLKNGNVLVMTVPYSPDYSSDFNTAVSLRGIQISDIQDFLYENYKGNNAVVSATCLDGGGSTSSAIKDGNEVIQTGVKHMRAYNFITASSKPELNIITKK